MSSPSGSDGHGVSGLRHSLVIATAILLAGAMVAGSVLWGIDRIIGIAQSARPQQISAGQPARPVAPEVNINDVTLDGEPFIGDPSAPAVMAYWYDYQCPFCREVELSVMPQLLKDYVETGKLRIYFKDFQFLGPDSQTAALASRAVWEVAPDRFYEWHRAVFQSQDKENAGWGSADDIMALTKTIVGIDAAKVEALMKAHAADYQNELDADLIEARAMGISGTPGMIIGSQLIAGAAPISQFRAAIDKVLASN